MLKVVPPTDHDSEGDNSYTRSGPKRRGIKWETVAIFDYHDQHGKLVFQVYRQLATRGGKHRPIIDDKTGKQVKQCFQRWVDTPENKKPKTNAPVLPYRLPELIAAVAAKQTIFVAEGEPKVDALRKWGEAATCSAEGAEKWKNEHAQFLRGADVVILPDNDARGRNHADLVGHSLEGIAARRRLLELPGLPDKGDIIDWIAAGGTHIQFKQLMTTATDWKPYDPTSAAPAFSEEQLALTFTEQHGHELRFVAKWTRWMVWTGAVWQEDDKRTTFTRARTICRDAAQRAGKKLARTLASAKTRAAVVSLAADDRRTIATVDQWDADSWLFNTPGGTIELKTGTLREHRPADYLTKLSAVAPDPRQPTPLWAAFLQRVTGGDAQLQAYLQRVAGYILTGVTYEHVLFFLHGDGANGKSVFISTLTGIMGDYHRPVPMDALMTTRNEQHPTELAGLLGIRAASAIETVQGRNWDEPKVTMLTGGDKITARLMRQDFFDFVPQFKLMIAGNHKPGLRSVNEAIRRRLHLVPFTVTIPAEERDQQLADKLKTEWPSVLAWMVEGCRQWQQQGLAPPAVVTDATNDYLEAQDIITQFIDENCFRETGHEVQSSVLFERWKAYAELRGERPGHQRSFNDSIVQKGFKRARSKSGSGFSFFGLGIFALKKEKPDDDASDDDGTPEPGGPGPVW